MDNVEYEEMKQTMDHDASNEGALAPKDMTDEQNEGGEAKSEGDR